MNTKVHIHGAITINIYGVDGDTQKVLDLVTQIVSKMTTVDQALASLLTAVQENASVDDSILQVVTNLKAQLEKSLSLTPEQQAKFNEIFGIVEADKKKIADAILANTTADPTTGEGGDTGSTESVSGAE